MVSCCKEADTGIDAGCCEEDEEEKEDEEKGEENFQDLSPIPFKKRSLFILKTRHSDTWKLRCGVTQSGK